MKNLKHFKKFPSIFLLLAIILGSGFIVTSCSSGKKALTRGDYYQSVLISVQRLRRNPDHKKSRETLASSYPASLEFFEDNIRNLQARDDRAKWRGIMDNYTKINSMYEEIRKSPGAREVIPNPKNYYDELKIARENAAEESYQYGLSELNKGNRESAKLAYAAFKDTDGYVSSYKDVNERMNQAYWMATLKVLIKPIPTAYTKVELSAQFFEDKIHENLKSQPINEFVKFLTVEELNQIGMQADHVLQLQFDEFTLGQIATLERQIDQINDSVVVGSVKNPAYNPNLNQSVPVNSVESNLTNNNEGAATNTNQTNTGLITTNTSTTKKETPKVIICHKDESNKLSNVEINASELLGHLKHGDSVGACTTENNESTEENKVFVCHKTDKGSINLEINESALIAHLEHGDSFGNCPVENKEEENVENNATTTGGTNNSTSTTNTTASNLTNTNQASNVQEPEFLYVYGTAKAKVFIFEKTLTSNGILDFKILDAQSNSVVATEKMAGEYVWKSMWGYFNGDERALTQDQLNITGQKEQNPPSDQELFGLFTEPIFNQVLNKVREFYSRY